MGTLTFLLTGIVIGTGVFAALMWSVLQTYQQRGSHRVTHGISVLATLGGMGSISLLLPIVAVGMGLILLCSATFAVLKDAGWSRILPLFQVLFAIALILGVPFGDGS